MDDERARNRKVRGDLMRERAELYNHIYKAPLPANAPIEHEGVLSQILNASPSADREVESGEPDGEDLGDVGGPQDQADAMEEERKQEADEKEEAVDDDEAKMDETLKNFQEQQAKFQAQMDSQSALIAQMTAAMKDKKKKKN